MRKFIHSFGETIMNRKLTVGGCQYIKYIIFLKKSKPRKVGRLAIQVKTCVAKLPEARKIK